MINKETIKHEIELKQRRYILVDREPATMSPRPLPKWRLYQLQLSSSPVTHWNMSPTHHRLTRSQLPAPYSDATLTYDKHRLIAAIKSALPEPKGWLDSIQATSALGAGRWGCFSYKFKLGNVVLRYQAEKWLFSGRACPRDHRASVQCIRSTRFLVESFVMIFFHSVKNRDNSYRSLLFPRQETAVFKVWLFTNKYFFPV